MTVTSLFSGSSGNAILVRAGNCAALVDAGVSFSRLTQALRSIGESPETLSGILITHEHSDHIAALPQIIKHTDLPLFLSRESAYEIYSQFSRRDEAFAARFASRVRTVEAGKSYACGELVFSPFSLPHDSVCCYGYTIGTEQNETILGIATDLGQMTVQARRALAGCENVILESNHDPELLKNGPYPRVLQDRIRSPYGHLSNQDSAALLQAAVRMRVKNALLFHLSRENNRPELALSCAAEALCALGAQNDVRVSVAAPDTPCFFVTES